MYKYDDAKQEADDTLALDDVIAEYMPLISRLWKYGDGYGGYVLARISQLAEEHGLPMKPPAAPTKAVISRDLARQVMERDAYRCVTCATHMSLTCDHIIPESKGGATTFENLQTMCRSCNSRKGNRSC